MTEKLKEFDEKEDIGKVIEGIWHKNFQCRDYVSKEGLAMRELQDEAPKEATHYMFGKTHSDIITASEPFGGISFRGHYKLFPVTYLRLRNSNRRQKK